jgi:hypothetical protein
MEMLFHQLRCTNESILGQPTTKIEAMVLGKPESIICVSDHFTIPEKCEIGFDNKKVSNILYISPHPKQVFKLKLKYYTWSPYPLLESIESINTPNL